jgi:hypothetical protein
MMMKMMGVVVVVMMIVGVISKMKVCRMMGVLT